MKTAYTRKLTMGERILHVNADTPINCVFAVRIKGALTAEVLRAALDKIQAKHPLLRMGITEDRRGKPYFVNLPSIGPIPIEVVTRYDDRQWETLSRRQWDRPFDKSRGPLAAMIWLKGPVRSELLWVCPHSVVDGVSCVALMREMLMLLDCPEATLTSYEPFKSVHDLLGGQRTALGWGTSIKTWLLGGIGRLALGLKTWGKSTARSGEGYLLHWRLPDEPSRALVTACKKQHTTVYAACCVAVLDAFASVLGQRAKGKVICPMDIRHFLPAIKNDHLFAFAPIVDVARVPGADFWERARQTKSTLSARMAQLDVGKLLLQGEHFHGLVPSIIKLLRRLPGDHDVTFSNMGRLPIPEVYSQFQVEALFSPSVGFPWKNPNTVVLSTYGGVMDFSFMSNTSVVTREEADSIRTHMWEQLTQAMGVFQEHVD